MVKEKTNQFWQTVRGMCILAVVLIHCEAPLNRGYGIADNIYYLFLRNLINFPVAVFFFISGYFVKNEENIAEYYKKRVLRLLLPYVVYSIAYILLVSFVTAEFSIYEALKKLLTGGAATPFYYIIVLFYFSLFTPLLMKCVNSYKKSTVIMLISPMILIAAYVALFFGNDFWSWLKYSPVWLSFYYGGMLVKAHRPKIRLSYTKIFLLAAFALQIAESLIMVKGNRSNVAFSQIRFSGFLYSCAMVMLIYCCSEYCNGAKEKKQSIRAFFSNLGNNSYGVFYLHSFGLIVCNSALSLIGFDMPLPLIHTIQVAVSLIVCFLVIKIINLLFKKRLSKLIFGV